MSNIEKITFTQDINTLLTNSPKVIEKVINNEAHKAFIQAFHHYGSLAQKHQREWIISRKIPDGCTLEGSLALNFGRLGAEGFKLCEIMECLRLDLEFGGVDGPGAEEVKTRKARRSPKQQGVSAVSDSKDQGQQSPRQGKPAPPHDKAAARKEPKPAAPKQPH